MDYKFRRYDFHRYLKNYVQCCEYSHIIPICTNILVSWKLNKSTFTFRSISVLLFYPVFFRFIVVPAFSTFLFSKAQQLPISTSYIRWSIAAETPKVLPKRWVVLCCGPNSQLYLFARVVSQWNWHSAKHTEFQHLISQWKTLRFHSYEIPLQNVTSDTKCTKTSMLTNEIEYDSN